MKVHNRLFTLEEANQLLPQIESALARLEGKKEAYAKQHDILFMQELLSHAERQNPSAAEANPQFEKDIRGLEEAIGDLEKDLHEIRELGCLVRNVGQGRIDFLGQRRGERIYFCWKRGEKSIQYYHALRCSLQERISL